MAHLQNLNVYHLAMENLKEIYQCLGCMRGHADLQDQIRRAALSVVSNIAEGVGRNSDKDFRRFLGIARGSNTEVAAQLDVAVAIQAITAQPALADRLNHVGRGLSNLIKRLEGS